MSVPFDKADPILQPFGENPGGLLRALVLEVEALAQDRRDIIAVIRDEVAPVCVQERNVQLVVPHPYAEGGGGRDEDAARRPALRTQERGIEVEGHKIGIGRTP